MLKNGKAPKECSSRGNVLSLKVVGAYGFKNGYEPNIYPMRGNWMWGAQAQIPVFDGGRVSHQEEEAQAAIESEQAHTQDVERQLDWMLSRLRLMFRHHGRRCKFQMFSFGRHMRRLPSHEHVTRRVLSLILIFWMQRRQNPLPG